MTVAEGSACPRWYALTRRICDVAVNLIHALHSGFWMGLLREKTLQAFDVHPHQMGSSHNNHLFFGTDLEPWEQLCLSNHFRKGNSILLIAGDGGREMASFQEAGIEVDAIDFSQEMVEKAHRHLDEQGILERVTLAPRYVLPTPSKDYHGIWIGRAYLSTIHDHARRIAFLKQLRHFASNRTTLFCSFYVRPGNGLDWRLNQWLGNVGRFLTRNPSVPVELGDHLDSEIPMYHHHFLEAELRDELEQAGWRLDEYTTDWYGYAMATPLLAAMHGDASQTLQQQV